MKEYTGIGHAVVSIPDDVYNILNRMDQKYGTVSPEDFEALTHNKDIDVRFMNTERMNDKEIKIYGIALNDSEIFQLVKVQ